MTILPLGHHDFSAYGRIHTRFSLDALLKTARATPIPAEGNIYTASDKAIEAFPVISEIRDAVFGELPIQAGFCNGHNSKLNAMEYHKSAELDIAVTDLILILGKYADIGNPDMENLQPNQTGQSGVKKNELPCWDSAKAQAFFIPKGSCVELFPCVLHFSPCRTAQAPFQSLIILPRGTNMPLSRGVDKNAFGEDRLLFMQNKWLIAHAERATLVEKGAHAGIIGINHEITEQALQEDRNFSRP